MAAASTAVRTLENLIVSFFSCSLKSGNLGKRNKRKQSATDKKTGSLQQTKEARTKARGKAANLYPRGEINRDTLYWLCFFRFHSTAQSASSTGVYPVPPVHEKWSLKWLRMTSRSQRVVLSDVAISAIGRRSSGKQIERMQVFPSSRCLYLSRRLSRRSAGYSKTGV